MPPSEQLRPALNDLLAAARNPAAQVADRATNLRITGMRTYLVSPTIFLRIDTNHGVFGWGEIKGLDIRPARVLAESLYELLDGENPTRIEHQIGRAACRARG